MIKIVVNIIIGVFFLISAASVFSKEDLRKRNIENALLPLPVILRKGAEVFAYDSAWHRIVLQKGSNGIRCQALGSVSLPPDLIAQCFHLSWEPSMVKVAQYLSRGMSVAVGFKTVVREIRAGTLRRPDTGAVLYELFGQHGLQGHANMAVAIPNATMESIGLPTTPDAYRSWLMMEGTPLAHIMIQGK